MDIEGVNEEVETTVQEPAEPETETQENASAETSAETSEEEAQKQTPEENAQYAAARRRAEAEFAARNARQRQELDEKFSNLAKLSGVTDVSGVDDYLQRLEEISLQKKLSDGNLDARQLREMVKNEVDSSPVVKQARETLVQHQMEEDVKEIGKIDPSIRTVEDILASETGESVVRRVQEKGMSLKEAWILENFEKLSEKKASAAKQAAVNLAKGKTHLEPAGGTAPAPTNEVEIPAAQLERWKEAFPDDTAAQLRARYNKAL